MTQGGIVGGWFKESVFLRPTFDIENRIDICAIFEFTINLRRIAEIHCDEEKLANGLERQPQPRRLVVDSKTAQRGR